MSTGLVRAIDELAASLDFDPALIAEPLESLVSDVRVTVLSYVGLKLILADHGHLVTMTVFDAGVEAAEIHTTVRMPVRARSRLARSGSMIVFYARTPGAFVDLAADLSYALQLPVTNPANPRPIHPRPEGLGVDLDGSIGVDQADVPQVLVSELTGVAERAVINRAVGVLLDRGQHPEETHRELSRHAALAGVSAAAYASDLLAELTTGQTPERGTFRILDE